MDMFYILSVLVRNVYENIFANLLTVRNTCVIK